MASNIDIDQSLLEEVMNLGQFRTKKEAINTLLENFVRLQNQIKAIDLFGKVDFDADYDYKEARSK